MGSGCNSKVLGSFLSGGLKTIPDTSVKYTGDPIPQLGICTGDLLSEVESVILNAILNYATGKGIMISGIDLTLCQLFVQEITCCNGPSTVSKQLDDLIRMIFTALCTLYTDYTTLKTTVDALINGPYVTGCLTLGVSPTLSQIIQELITEYCVLVGRVTALELAVSTLSSGLSASIGNFLNSAISTCQTDSFVKSGSGASWTLALKGANPIGAIIMYGGPIVGVFDGTGKGYNPGPACGYQLCNGQNGSVDMRGFVPVGVNDGTMGGGSQIAIVDNAINPGQNYAFNTTCGEIKHILSPSEIPATPLTINDDSTTHIHGFVGRQDNYKFGGDRGAIDAVDPSFSGGASFFSGVDGVIAPTTLHITGTVGGGGGSHENRQPSKAVYFIQRIA